MTEFLKNSVEASQWIEDTKALHAGDTNFGTLRGSVIWSDARRTDGQQLVPVDPMHLIAKINAGGFPLLRGHDPGFPVGKVLSAAHFTHADGEQFVAAVFGYYYGGKHLSFHDLGFDEAIAAPSPAALPALPETCGIIFANDPREVEASWIEGVLSDAPLRVERRRLSHNAADVVSELIRIGLPYVVLVWNPFVTAIATEAGKATYAGIHGWVRKLLTKSAEIQNPVIEIQSYQDGCQVSFLFRGTDVKRHYAAHNALPAAAARAARLVAHLKTREKAAKLVVYEFHPDDNVWYPSYAELNNGRLIVNNLLLIAAENLPNGLSLGLSLSEDAPD